MLKEISYKDLNINPMTLFADEWAALSSGNAESGYNSMCIAWGHLGTIWERENHSKRIPTAVCFVRPHRYTKILMDKSDTFSISFFPADYKKTLGYLGSKSGRNEDKLTNCALTPVYEDGTVYFSEANLVFICKTLYHAPLSESGFMDKDLIDFNYSNKDFHEMYVGEIVKVLKSE